MTALPPLWNPSESLYTDLADLPSLMKIAWLEALAHPERAEEIIAEAVATAKQVSQVASMHLKGSVERATRKENALEKALAAAEKRVTAGLDVLISTAEDHLDPHGYYVYLLWGAREDAPLYVGQSTNIYGRLGDHMRAADRRYRVKRITVIRCKTASQMEQTEMRLIRHYRPELNTAGIPTEVPAGRRTRSRVGT